MGKIKVVYERENPLPDWATAKVVKAMHDEGRSLRNLAKQFGVSHQTIANLIERAKEEALNV